MYARFLLYYSYILFYSYFFFVICSLIPNILEPKISLPRALHFSRASNPLRPLMRGHLENGRRASSALPATPTGSPRKTRKSVPSSFCREWFTTTPMHVARSALRMRSVISDRSAITA